MLEDLENILVFTTSTGEIVRNLSVALICGYLISLIYRITYKGPGYSVTFVHSIVLLAMITSVVIIVIGNNLARAFGLVGAMSIVRFRTAVKETRDIVYIFFGLTVGMAAGVGLHKLAILCTLFVGLILYLFSRYSLTESQQKEYLLQFCYTPDGSKTPPYTRVMEKYCRRHKVINVKSVGEDNTLELSYYVKFRDLKKNQEFARELQSIRGVQYINLFFDEEQF
jgi:uncharacterized membrane protein YhiD involved in acid resistance